MGWGSRPVGDDEWVRGQAEAAGVRLTVRSLPDSLDHALFGLAVAPAEGRAVIAVGPRLSGVQRRLVLLHELGHVLLGHLRPGAQVECRSTSQAPNRAEAEAEAFARSLLLSAGTLDDAVAAARRTVYLGGG